jgi:glycosyltransferase involved in cell wall biosynthesis
MLAVCREILSRAEEKSGAAQKAWLRICPQTVSLASRLMKILHVETGRHFYGGAQQVVWLVAGLNSRGVENRLVCLPGSGIDAVARRSRVDVLNLDCSGDLDLRFAWRLRSLLTREAPDIVHCHSRRGADFLGGQAAAMAGIPALLSRRVDSADKGKIPSLRYRPYRQVIAISNHIGEVLLDGGLSKDRMTVISSAVDATNLPYTADRKVLQSQFGIGPKHFAIAVAAQLIPRKGHQYLIDALANCPETMPNKLVVFGSGPLEAELRAQCRRKELNDKVHFAGFRDDLDTLLPAFDLLVHPATSEGLGVAMLKAAAAGVPVIAFDVAGATEAVQHERTGVLVSAGDVTALRDAIVRLAGDAALREAYGKAGRERMLSAFSVEQMVSDHLRIYERVLDDGV